MDMKLLGILGGKLKRYPRNLETKYPHIFEKIMALWDSPAIDDYFSELMVSSRDGHPSFPPDVAAEILRLSLFHSTQSQLGRSNAEETKEAIAAHSTPVSKMDQWLLRILGGKVEKYPRNLESKHPRILGKIMALWDSPEIDDYFMELLITDRSDRAGFPPEVASEILHLNLVHSSLNKAKAKYDKWDSRAKLIDFIPQVPAEDAGIWVELTDAVKRDCNRLGILCNAEGFLRAAESGNLVAMTLFLESHVSTETRNAQGCTPLMLAALNGRSKIVSLLIQFNANVFARDLGGNTPLHWAAFYGHASIAKMLIEKHAQIDAVNSFGLTPLYQSVARHHFEVAKMLVENGANMELSGRDGWTALHKAASTGFIEIVQLLMANGADINVKNIDGDTPVKLAIKNNQQALLKFLMTMPGSVQAG